MSAMLPLPWVREISAVYCSTEQKALDGAEILARHLGLASHVLEELGENDRTSTGYLKQEAFLGHVARFFGNPDQSIDGWEAAQDAQNRLVNAVKAITTAHDAEDHLAVVAHGGVGALLLTSLMRKSISLEQEQPGMTGGNYFTFDPLTWSLVHGWLAIDG